MMNVVNNTDSRIERVELPEAQRLYEGEQRVTIILRDQLSTWEQLAVPRASGYALSVLDSRHLVWNSHYSEVDFSEVVKLIDAELSERALLIEREAHTAWLDARELLLPTADEHGFEVR